MMRPVVLGLAAALHLAGCGPAPEPADLLLHNGKIVTMDDSLPQVQALAARAGRIVAVGDDGDLHAYIGPSTRVIDLHGRLAVPGFIEGHAHLLNLGERKLILDLTAAETWEEIVDMVEAAAREASPGEWIRGRGWHQEKWAAQPAPHVGGFPVHDTLSRVSENNPVHLRHASGHASIGNARAMERAGIDASTPDPPGGKILRDGGGRPIGVFIETAQGLINRAFAEDRANRSLEQIESDRRRKVQLAVEDCLSKGITSFHDAGSSFETVDLLRDLVDEGQLGLRLYVMIRAANAELREKLAPYRMVGYGDGHLTVRAIKKSIDGALGTRGAWLLEPYADQIESTGHNTETVENIQETARLAVENDYQLCVHAIGDRANREMLNVYERTFREHPDHQKPRWRIEHVQHLHPDDLVRFAELGVIASVQGIHCTSDAPWVIERLGADRAREGAYAWRKLLDSGALVINGTDAPVEDVNPIENFYASVTRRLTDGSEFFPDQRMTHREALRSYTLDAAFAAFEEEIKGSLSPGKFADVTVLSRDILTVPDEELPSTEVVYTIVGGKVMYQKAEAY